jgi:hypothetical protein
LLYARPREEVFLAIVGSNPARVQGINIARLFFVTLFTLFFVRLSEINVKKISLPKGIFVFLMKHVYVVALMFRN